MALKNSKAIRDQLTKERRRIEEARQELAQKIEQLDKDERQLERVWDALEAEEET